MDRDELKYLLITSILLALSFPPFPFGFFAPVALAIFLFFIKDYSIKNSFRLGYWLGLIWGAFTLFWIAASTVVGALLAISINALHYAIVWWIYALFKEKNQSLALIAFPFIWVAAEYFRLFSDIRFNWMILAHTQTYFTPLIQIIEITGYHFLSFIVIICAVSIYALFQFKNKYRVIPAIFSFLALCLLIFYGVVRLNALEEKKFASIRCGIIQPNVDPYEKWDPLFRKQAFDALMDGSRELASENLDLIVWPETATPFYLRNREDILEKIHHFLSENNLYLLTGTPDFGFNEEFQETVSYNAAFFFQPDLLNFEFYYKLALVPASESMPFKKKLKFLRNIDVGGGDFFPGKDFKVFNFKIQHRTGKFSDGQYHEIKADQVEDISVGLSAVICYDSVFPHLVRQFVMGGANLLTIITNDGWFGTTSGPYQHAQMAVLRAVENRISIIRCANTGISSFIDPAGRVLKYAELNTKKNLTSLLPLRNVTTLYTRYGDWFGKLTVWVSLLLIIIKLVGLRFLKFVVQVKKYK
jgi:apolipoprotein N-acyltransferase